MPLGPFKAAALFLASASAPVDAVLAAPAPVAAEGAQNGQRPKKASVFYYERVECRDGAPVAILNDGKKNPAGQPVNDIEGDRAKIADGALSLREQSRSGIKTAQDGSNGRIGKGSGGAERGCGYQSV